MGQQDNSEQDVQEPQQLSAGESSVATLQDESEQLRRNGAAINHEPSISSSDGSAETMLTGFSVGERTYAAQTPGEGNEGPPPPPEDLLKYSEGYRDPTGTPTPDGGWLVVDKKGNRHITYPNGVYRNENTDGSGNTQWKDKDGNIHVHNWGPKDDDNYDSVSYPDRFEMTYKNGKKTTSWPNQVSRTEYPDGTGEVFRMKPGGFELQHWGPRAQDNYTHVVNGKTQTMTYADGRRYEKSEDGSAVWDRADGTGWKESRDKNGHFTREFRGLKPEDVAQRRATTDGGIEEIDKQGNKFTYWKDGTLRAENKDGTGYIRRPTPDGNYFVRHWGPGENDNYVQANRGASTEFDERVNKAYRELPANVRNAIGADLVVSSRNASDWRRSDGTIDHNLGHFNGKELHVSEDAHVKDAQGKGGSETPEETLRHEAGHALDKAMHDFSKSAEFRAAFDKELAQLPPDYRKEIGRYLKDGHDMAAAQVFAEVFRITHGPQPPSAKDAQFMKHFSGTAQVMMGRISQLK